ncbi:RNA polymerase, sigma 28 subunit, SigD/FliA/WhiG [Collimonas sp. OK242]|jgi:RNA polymerase sigma factor for flagellar operon FliA|uniref:RNA polymerase sigma factor FliA n=1 Tax=Collimonas sp. OK242 TaxID=1798195 RepID=UPI0008960D65|nr:RNA polymerase sigma factor FliA [Collimonas sp. OK242]SDX47636.1 RNA polymerase, sigma 28 subunit, SigD/FliA/WhiG [Collimonas sp. OK242]
MYTAQGKIDKSDTLAKYAPLVRRLALQLIAKLPASVELDDMIQAGMLGLLDAANRYQDDQGAQFETYASQRIRGAMLDELRANDWLSRGLRQSSRKVDAAVQALEQKLSRSPSEREIAVSMQLSLEDYQHLLQEIHGSQLVYYEDCEGGGNENSFLDRQHGYGDRGGADDPLQRMLDSGMRHMLVEAIALMPERERLLLSLYYEQEMNLREIGAVLEVSQSRVCQLHSQAISRLRVRLSEASRSELA